MFHVSLLKQDIIKKEQIDNQANQTLPEPEKKFKIRNIKEYKVKVFVNNIIYSHNIENYGPGFVYLVL